MDKAHKEAAQEAARILGLDEETADAIMTMCVKLEMNKI